MEINTHQHYYTCGECGMRSTSHQPKCPSCHRSNTLSLGLIPGDVVRMHDLHLTYVGKDTFIRPYVVTDQLGNWSLGSETLTGLDQRYLVVVERRWRRPATKLKASAETGEVVHALACLGIHCSVDRVCGEPVITATVTELELNQRAPKLGRFVSNRDD